MQTTTYPGINYAGNQPVNIDTETGIRYGIISQHDVNPDALDDIFSHGTDEDYESWKEAIHDGIRSALRDYLSERAIARIIEHGLDDIGDDYQGIGDCARYSYDADGYALQTDSSGDLWVFKSPYFTYAQFCSPCAPGACHLGKPLQPDVPGNPEYNWPPEGNKCYCLGPDWFEDGKAPYNVFSVETGELVAS